MLKVSNNRYSREIKLGQTASRTALVKEIKRTERFLNQEPDVTFPLYWSNNYSSHGTSDVSTCQYLHGVASSAEFGPCFFVIKKGNMMVNILTNISRR